MTTQWMLSLCTHWIEGIPLLRFKNITTVTLIVTISTLLLVNMSSSTGTRVTRQIHLPQRSIGSRSHLLIHSYGPKDTADGSVSSELSCEYSYPESEMEKTRVEKVYIQASLHADELPGIVVANHLIKLLEQADQKGLIRKQIVIIPYANPIGLSQKLMGSHIGRFSLSTGS